ncbi:nudix hydrolase 15, mitochondrial-like isoform X1 [Canna indica]|uniref:Nudix hydrolase 15, mitochondrial-like isoform X1 n=1 Tax=Canna indica TaxID=4628 RepID=A0AAQ3KLY8_9LILI|nr:nudix hydrolase 15, mitochondrial-like isoform X1 [Canna indica]
MRLKAVLRKASSMAASPGPKQSTFSNLTMVSRGGYRLQVIAQQLRLYHPAPGYSSSSPADADGDDAVLDDRGKVFSTMALPHSSASAVLLRRPPDPKPAAVLICLFEDDSGDLRVLLTKRSSNLSSHSGEVSLPGGKAEEGDADERETALREAKEEIGLDPSLVTVVTVLESFLSKHLLRVSPVIGILPNKEAFRPAANTDEVDEIFDAPLEMFLKDDNRRSEVREWKGLKYLIHYFDYNSGNKKFVIWGLTAAILIRAASIIYKRPPSFVEQL